MSKKKTEIISIEQQNKSVHGNTYQNNFYETLKKRSDVHSVEKNKFYSYNGERKFVDVEFQVHNNKIVNAIENTTSSRDDRISGKERHAEVTKRAMKEDGLDGIYVLVLPSDTYYDTISNTETRKREIKNNNKCIDRINNSNGFSHIDIAIKEDQVDDYIKIVSSYSGNSKKYLKSKVKKQLLGI